MVCHNSKILPFTERYDFFFKYSYNYQDQRGSHTAPACCLAQFFTLDQASVYCKLTCVRKRFSITISHSKSISRYACIGPRLSLRHRVIFSSLLLLFLLINVFVCLVPSKLHLIVFLVFFFGSILLHSV